MVFEVSASDGVDVVGTGTHESFIIEAETFINKIAEKTSQKASS
jgi:predicted thioesterase